MNVKWLIESDAFPEDTTPTLEALERNGIEYKVVPFKPFELDEYLELYPGEQCVVFYGSLGLAKKLRRKAQWIPGIYYNVPVFDCVRYYAHLGKYLLNGNYIFLPFGDLIRQKEFLYHHLGADRTIFLRPNRGDKIFTGQLIYKEKFEEEIERFGFGQITAEELVVASEPANIRFEWRFVVVESQVVAGSQYKENDRCSPDPACPEEAFQFASEIARTYQPDDAAWVVDICQTRGGKYRLMEIGCFSCAGLYRCDRDAIVQAVSDAALREWQSYQLD